MNEDSAVQSIETQRSAYTSFTSCYLFGRAWLCGSSSMRHLNMQSSCTLNTVLYMYVSTGLHLHTLSTSFVRWQMSRLVSDSVPVHPHHWSSAVPDCLPSVTELFRSPLLASGTVCLILSLLYLMYSCLPRSRLKTHLFNISYPSLLWLYSACAVTLSCFLTL